MPTTCKIHFDNNKNVVYSGQKICITVRLKFTENVKVRSIYIYLRGKTQVRFNLDDESKHGTYMGSENLLDMRKCLADGNGGTVLYSVFFFFFAKYQMSLVMNSFTHLFVKSDR